MEEEEMVTIQIQMQILETTTENIDLEALAALALNPYNNAEVRGTGEVFIAVQLL